MPKGWDLGGGGGGQGGQNFFFVKFSPQGQTGILGVRSKGQISVNFNYKVKFNDFYTKHWLYSQK